MQSWQDHLSGLPEALQQLFRDKQVSDVGTFLKYLEEQATAQAGRSRAIKYARKIEPLVQFVNRYAPIAQTMVQAHPSPAVVVLGGISCILDIPSGLVDFRDKTSETLAEMGKRIEILAKYETTEIGADSDVQNALCNIYGDILQFCGEVAKLLYDNHAKPRNIFKTLRDAALTTFQSKHGKILQKFHRDVIYFKEAADFVTRQVQAEFRQNVAHALMQSERHNQDIAGLTSAMSQVLITDMQRRQAQEQTHMDAEWRRKRGECLPKLPRRC